MRRKREKEEEMRRTAREWSVQGHPGPSMVLGRQSPVASGQDQCLCPSVDAASCAILSWIPAAPDRMAVVTISFEPPAPELSEVSGICFVL